MWTLRFWQSWPRANRAVLFMLLVFFAVAIVNMWVAYFVTPAPAIELQTVVEPDLSEITVDQFTKGPFNFSVKGNNYVILQRQLGSVMATSETVAYSYLLFMAVFVIGMLSVISTLGRFYYLVGMGAFILFVTSLSPEVLGVLGGYGKTFTVIVMALYCFASFWLFYFATTASFTKRILTFTAITVLLWAIIYLFSETELPFLFIATYSTEAAMIACILFIVTVSHEIIAGFIFAVTQSSRGGKSLNHFGIISVIYLVNLVLAYCVRFGFILYWDLITIDLFLLLTISAILGLWGIRQRKKVFEGIIDADPYAVFAFVLMGTFTFASIAMLMYNANDTALSALSDVIIFSHLGFGFIFIIYILSNFIPLLEKNYAVHKVLYDPSTMPYFTFRFAGLITTIALIIYNAWQIPVHNAMSGYYNGIGDLYLKLENTRLAKAWYEESRAYGFSGHHAHYALANLAGGEFDATGERAFLVAASRLRPTQMSYLNLAQTYQVAGDNMQAILTLNEGVKKLKDHESLENTLGILYSRMGLPDSANKYLGKSKGTSSFNEMASANIAALAALGRLETQVDTTSTTKGNPVMLANSMALNNVKGIRFNESFTFPTDTVITLAQAAGLNNYLLNTSTNEDTTFVKKVLALARRPSNIGFKEPLLYSSAIALYNSGQTKEAFLVLEEITYNSELKGKYNNILAMWSLENNEPQRAVVYADYAVSQNYEPSNVTYAVAVSESSITPGGSSKRRDAVNAWDSLRHSTDTVTVALADRVHKLLTGDMGITPDMTDNNKHIIARYRYSAADSSSIMALASSMTDDNVKARVFLELAEQLHTMDQPAAALRTLQKITGLELTNPVIGQEMQTLEMLIRVQLGQTSLVLDALKQQPVTFKGKDAKYRMYFEALQAQAAGDSVNAKKMYTWLGTSNPFFEDGLIAAANYYKDKGIFSYNMLAEGVLYHPTSVRIKKAYALQSARVGLESYALDALEELKAVISAKEYTEMGKEISAILTNKTEE